MKSIVSIVLAIITFTFLAPFDVEALPITAKNEIVVLSLGDSITAGMDDKNGWVGNVTSNLNAILRGKGKNWRFVGQFSRDNVTYYQAQGGYCLASTKYDCPTAVSKPGSILELYYKFRANNKDKVNLFIIQGGVNDFNSSSASNPPPNPINSMKILISQIFKDIPNAFVIVQGITRSKLTAQESEYNKNLAKIKLKNVYFVDMAPVNDSINFIDGLHPNARGYKLMSTLLYNKLKTIKF